MKSLTKIRSRRARMAGVLAAAAVLVSATVVWSGTSALATVVNVASSTPAQLPPAPERLGTTAAPSPSRSDAATHQSHAPGAPAVRLPQIIPPEAASPSGVGNRPEVSLEEAGRAEVGPAARSRQGKDRSGNLPKASVATPGDVLGASPSLGGCLAEYGDDGQCLPSVPPSLSQHLKDMKDAGLDPASMPHNWTCSEVRQYFRNGLTVREAGVDPQELDSNADGTACGSAD